MTQSLTEQIKDQAKQYGADLVGIASIDRFENFPAETHPRSIFPECQSVIVLGRRVLRGAIRGIEEGTNFGSTYVNFGYRWLADTFLSQTTYDVTCFIESISYEAVPLHGYEHNSKPTGAPVAPGKPAPNVLLNVPLTAQVAGLGRVGKGGFFLTPQFGTRQRLNIILTDAKLEPDHIVTEDVCAGCNACQTACPFGAIQSEMESVGKLDSQDVSVFKMDYSYCQKCPNGAMQGPGQEFRPDRIAAACGRGCMIRLEKEGLCSNKFENEFRKRTPWTLDLTGQPMKQ